MTKCWLIPFFMAGLLGDKAFADCLPAEDTPASVIEYFQKFNKPLPEKFCAKEAPLQASHEPPQDSSQTEEGPDPDDGPFSQYQGDLGRGYESDQNGGYEIDQGGRYERDEDGGYERGEGYERDLGRGYETGPGGGYEREHEAGYQGDWYPDSDNYWKNDDKDHKGGDHRKGDGKHGKKHGKRKSACKKAHMKWNKSTKTCSKGS
jgi:hypothetical protein